LQTEGRRLPIEIAQCRLPIGNRQSIINRQSTSAAGNRQCNRQSAMQSTIGNAIDNRQSKSAIGIRR